MNKHNRNSMIAKIKIAQKQLHMDDSAYRELLLRLTSKTSCAKMNQDELERVLREMRRLGFKPTKNQRHVVPKHRRSTDAMMSKISALLADNKLPWSYADAICKRMFSVDKVQWLSDEHMHTLIGVLQIHANRIYEECDPCLSEA